MKAALRRCLFRIDVGITDFPLSFAGRPAIIPRESSCFTVPEISGLKDMCANKIIHLWKSRVCAPVFLIAAIIACWTMPAQAARMPATTIRIAEISRMNWGTLAIPASGTQYVDLNPANQTVQGTGKVLFGAPSRGIYKLTRTGDMRTCITIDVATASTGSANVKIDRFKGIYSSVLIRDFPSPTLPPPSDGPRGTLLYLGARATVNSAMSAGSLTPTFDINVIVN
jgi:hypothetical protein